MQILSWIFLSSLNSFYGINSISISYWGFSLRAVKQWDDLSDILVGKLYLYLHDIYMITPSDTPSYYFLSERGRAWLNPLRWFFNSLMLVTLHWILFTYSAFHLIFDYRFCWHRHLLRDLCWYGSLKVVEVESYAPMFSNMMGHFGYFAVFGYHVNETSWL
jgi:hypothetical protein